MTKSERASASASVGASVSASASVSVGVGVGEVGAGAVLRGGICFKGASFVELRAELIWLAGITLFLIIVASMRFQKKLD